jgi:hypothetical protein
MMGEKRVKDELGPPPEKGDGDGDGDHEDTGDDVSCRSQRFYHFRAP